MRIFSRLLQDEFGSILSAEVVVVGTIAVIGATAGLSAASKSIDSELYEFASAIRHLDQSYSASRIEIDGDWSAESSYTQPDLKKSLKELEKSYLKDKKADAKRAEELRRAAIAEQEKVDAANKAPTKKRTKKRPKKVQKKKKN